MLPSVSRRKNHRVTASIDALREATGQDPEDLRVSSSPWHELHVSDRKRLVQKALSEIPDEYREALVMKEIDDLKYEEIAEILEIPIGTGSKPDPSGKTGTPVKTSRALTAGRVRQLELKIVHRLNWEMTRLG